jgi:hypothetical protein
MSQKKKNCVVCDILNEYPDIALRFNTKLKLNIRIKEIIQDFHTLGVQNVPTKYYLEQHRDYCLLDFVVEQETPIINPQNNINPTPPSDQQSIPDDFKDKSLFDKTLWFQNKLIDLIYVNLSKINMDIKTPKQDIDVIKTLFDLAYRPYVDLSEFSFSNDKNDLETTGLNLIRKIMSTNILSEDTTLDIVKLLLKSRISEDYNDRQQKDILDGDLSKLDKIIDFLENPNTRKLIEKKP